jgi:hypothetical protein
MENKMTDNPFNDMSDEEFQRRQHKPSTMEDATIIHHGSHNPDHAKRVDQLQNIVSPIVLQMIDKVDAAIKTPVAMVVVMVDQGSMALLSNMGESEALPLKLLQEFLATATKYAPIEVQAPPKTQ